MRCALISNNSTLPAITHIQARLRKVAQSLAPESRVVYVDYDPVVLAHARALLTSDKAGATKYIHADVRDTGAIVAGAAELLDFTRPVAVTLLSILHVIPDSDDPHAIVAALMDATPSGSYLAISHGGIDFYDKGKREEMAGILPTVRHQQQFTFRTRDQVARFFAGLDLVEPGVVPVEDWRPKPGEADAGKSCMWCAVARKG